MFSNLTWARKMGQGVWCLLPILRAELSPRAHSGRREQLLWTVLWPPRGPIHMRPQNKNLRKLFFKKKNQTLKRQIPHSPKHHLYDQYMKTEAKVTSISNFVEFLNKD